MPLYPYRCTKCGHRFEKIQKFEDEPETTCPNCGGALERPLTAPGFQFKGAGWYVNDYSSKSSSSGSTASASSESKPASGDTAASASPAPAAPTATAAKPSESKS